MIPTSGYRVIKNATTGEILLRKYVTWEVVMDTPNNARLIVDHGPLTVKFKKSGLVVATLESENGRVITEQRLGYYGKHDTLVFTPR